MLIQGDAGLSIIIRIFPSEQVSAAHESLQHVPDPVALLAESCRFLKPGGLIFGDVPFLQPLYLAPHHYFNFTPYGLEVVAKNAGLELQYAAAEAHQRPEFSPEWLLRRRSRRYRPPRPNGGKACRWRNSMQALRETKT